MIFEAVRMTTARLWETAAPCALKHIVLFCSVGNLPRTYLLGWFYELVPQILRNERAQKRNWPQIRSVRTIAKKLSRTLTWSQI